MSGGAIDPYAAPAARHNEGHGRRLPTAFEALESYPVLVESRNRVLRLFESGRPSMSDVVTAVEADLALRATAVRLATQLDARARGRGGRGRARARAARRHARPLRPRRHPLPVGDAGRHEARRAQPDEPADGDVR